MDIILITRWFEAAVPAPTAKNQAVQVGCHWEEVAEMADALDDPMLADLLYRRADQCKQDLAGIESVDRKALLDALCDQIVTAVGVAHMFKLDIGGALAEVNRSNWSKFVDGKPVFNAHGKITKGPNYAPPALEPYL